MKTLRTHLSFCLTILAVILCALALPTRGNAATYGDLFYEIHDGEVTITGCSTSATGKLDIPSTIEGYPVTSIGEYAFEDDESLTAITIPDTVTNIGEYAFTYCTSLTRITIPDRVTIIGGGAFSNCTNLISITIPDSVISIGSSAFSDTAWYDSQTNGVLYAGKVLYSVKGRCPTSVTIQDGTVEISDHAFFDCDRLTSITIPSSVTSIGDFAFADCANLSGIWVDESNMVYRSNTQGILFSKDMTSLLQAPGAISGIYTIPDTVTSIGAAAFYGCADLTSVIIPDGITSIDWSTFSNCTGLTSLVIPNSVTNIRMFAFSECSNLENIFYSGTEGQWNAIIWEDGYVALQNATIHYNHVPQSGQTSIDNPLVAVPHQNNSANPEFLHVAINLFISFITWFFRMIGK